MKARRVPEEEEAAHTEEACLPPLITAAEVGDVAAVRALLSQGVDVKVCTKEEKFTACHKAALRGHADVLAVLVGSGADVNAAASCRSTPAFVASQNNQHFCLQILVDAGCDVDAAGTGGSTPAITAAWNGHLPCLEMLIGAGCDINKPDDNGATPALACTFNGHTACLDVLVSAGANLNAADNEGSTPAVIATWNGHAACLRTLAVSGADLRRADNDGCTPSIISLKGERENDLACRNVLASFGCLDSQKTGGHCRRASNARATKLRNELAGLVRAGQWCEVSRRITLPSTSLSGRPHPLSLSLCSP